MILVSAMWSMPKSVGPLIRQSYAHPSNQPQLNWRKCRDLGFLLLEILSLETSIFLKSLTIKHHLLYKVCLLVNLLFQVLAGLILCLSQLKSH